VKDSGIDIQADKVPLIQILKILSEKTGLTLKTGDPLENSVSIELKSVSIEHCFQRLLANLNYAIIYRKIDKNEFVPLEVRVFGRGSLQKVDSVTLEHPFAQGTPRPPTDPMKRYSPDWYEQQFGNPDKLLKEISVAARDEDSYKRGFRITKISPESVFHKIGLTEGDIIQDVDGRQVNTLKEFVERLQHAHEGKTTVRIERYNKSNMIDPIYIELQSP